MKLDIEVADVSTADGFHPDLDAKPWRPAWQLTFARPDGLCTVQFKDDRVTTSVPQKWIRDAQPEYVIREHSRHWGNSHRRTKSIPIGLAGSRDAAVFRVRAVEADQEEAFALARRLVKWLNGPDAADHCPAEVPLPDADKSARIKITPGGRLAGFLPVGRRAR